MGALPADRLEVPEPVRDPLARGLKNRLARVWHVEQEQAWSRGARLLVVVAFLALVGSALPALASPSAVAGAVHPSSCTFTGQTINGAGATDVAPLIDQWEVSYTANALDYSSVGSGTGVVDLQDLVTDFAADNAPLDPSQVNGFGSDTVLTLPSTAGSLSVIYNLAGSWHAPLNLTASVLAQIYTGTITNWNDAQIQALNPVDDLPSSAIVVVHRSDTDGSSYDFQQFLAYDGQGSWPYNYSDVWLGPSDIPGEIAAKGSSGVTSEVKATVGAISYVELEYALTNGVEFAAVQNPSGFFVLPSLASTQSAILDKVDEAGFALPAGNGNWSSVEVLNPPGAADYPISYLSYVMVYENGSQAYGATSSIMDEAIEESTWAFLNWSVSSSGGQSYASPLYYVPLPASVAKNAVTSLELLTWDGTPIYTCGLPSLASVSVSPSSASLELGATQAFQAQVQCSGGPCPAGLTLAWSQAPALGTLTTDGAAANFTAGSAAGTTTLTVRATSGTTVREANATVTIEAPSTPFLVSVRFDPASGPSLATGATLDILVAPVCSLGVACPGGTQFLWTPDNDFGSLNATSGTAVAFTAGTRAGEAQITVVGTLNGVHVSELYNISISNSTVAPSPSGGGTSPLVLYVGIAVAAAVALLAVFFLVFRRRTPPLPPPGAAASPPPAPPSYASWPPSGPNSPPT